MPKIINLGSLCIDHVYQVPQLVGAGETTASTTHQIFAGGKGLNQSIAAARAGATVHHAGAVGHDGGFLIEQLADAGVDVQLILQQAGNSGHAVIQVDDQGQNAIVIAGGSNRNLPATLVQSAIAQLEPSDWLLLQNEVNDLPNTLTLAADAQVAFNIAPVDGRESSYDLSNVALLIVNPIEIQALASQGATPQAALTELHQRLPDTDIVLTLGDQGLLFCPAQTRTAPTAAPPVLQLSAHSVSAIDETAAGDAFIGYLLAARSQGQGIEEALQQASAAGALAVTQAGAAPSIPSAAEVAAFRAAMPELSRSYQSLH